MIWQIVLLLSRWSTTCWWRLCPSHCLTMQIVTKTKGQAKCTPKIYYMQSKILEWASVHSKKNGLNSCPLSFLWSRQWRTSLWICRGLQSHICRFKKSNYIHLQILVKKFRIWNSRSDSVAPYRTQGFSSPEFDHFWCGIIVHSNFFWSGIQVHSKLFVGVNKMWTPEGTKKLEYTQATIQFF
jgi:hypothetical protein